MLFFLLYNQDQYGKVLNTKLGCNYNSLSQSYCKAFIGTGNSSLNLVCVLHHKKSKLINKTSLIFEMLHYHSNR